MSRAHLYAAADLVGAGVGFLTPLFRLTGLNQQFMQTEDDAGAISGFARCDVSAAPLVRLDERAVETGEPALWVFAFDKDDLILGRGGEGKEELRRRLSDDFFVKRPLLGVEAAEFLEERAERGAFARKAYERFAGASPRAAHTWRDLSILTPDVIAALRRLPDAVLQQGVADLRQVTAVTEEDGAIVVRGILETASQATRTSVLGEVARAFSDLKPLYSDVWSTPPKVRLRPTAGAPASRAPTSEPRRKALVILDERLERLGEAFSRERAGEYVALPLNEAAGFVHGLQQDDHLSLASLTTPVRHLPYGRPHLALWQGGVGRRISQQDIGELPMGSVVVDAPLTMNQNLGAGSVARALSNAVLVLETLAEIGPRRVEPELQFYVQGSGAGPDALLDGWCQAYGKLARLDLAGAPGHRFYTARGGHGDEYEPVLQAMFPQLEPLWVPIPSRRRRYGACGVLVDGTRRIDPEAAEAVHSSVVLSVAEFRNWRIDHMSYGPYRAVGYHDDVELWTRTPDPIDPSPFRHRRIALEARPFHAERVVVLPDATPGEVLHRLVSHRELLVSLRDLALSDPAVPPHMSLVAAQLRRFATSLPSSTKSAYYAAVTLAALDKDRSGQQKDGGLRDLAQEAVETEIVTLLCTSVNFDGNVAIANMRCAPTGAGSRLHQERVADYKLIFGPHGVEVA